MQVGDKSAVIATLLVRFYYAATLVKLLKCRQEIFILQTLLRIAQVPGLSSLSPLCKLETIANLYLFLHRCHTAGA